jgi:hypothetical protein
LRFSAVYFRVFRGQHLRFAASGSTLELRWVRPTAAIAAFWGLEYAAFRLGAAERISCVQLGDTAFERSRHFELP